MPRNDSKLDDLSALKLKWIELEKSGPVLRAWFNRPQARNAHDQAMIQDVVKLFTALNDQTDIRVVVLGGRGKTFCAGADRREEHAQSPSASAARYASQLGRRATRAIEDCEVVTIARVHGHAIGGGCCFALCCDFRICTSDTQWYVPEVDLGVPLPWGATPRLISEIGMARARQFIMTSEHIDGQTAAAWGMAHEVCADEDALELAVDRWVQRVVNLPALSVQMTKHQLRGYSQLTRLGDLSEFDGDVSASAIRSADAQDRFASF